MKLNSLYVEKPWGRTDLPSVFGEAAGRKIGEVWFDAPDQPLPILIKWLFTSEKLSIQVHPNDEQAMSLGLNSGKEECWIIVSAEPGARLGMGTLRPLSADELRSASISGEIEQLMSWKPIKAGDYFYIPAGTVHAIGAGITLVEVQQNADITYRLYDYGRPRELHLNNGIAVSDAKPYHDPQSGTVGAADVQLLVNGPYFDLWYARGCSIEDLARYTRNIWIIPLAGQIIAGAETAQAGECLYLEENVPVLAESNAVALVASRAQAITE